MNENVNPPDTPNIIHVVELSFDCVEDSTLFVGDDVVFGDDVVGNAVGSNVGGVQSFNSSEWSLINDHPRSRPQPLSWMAVQVEYLNKAPGNPLALSLEYNWSYDKSS